MTNVDDRNYIFLSGMMRSGTTLVQRAIDSHPHVRIKYQPKTNDLITLKTEFLIEIGRNPYHALYHYNPVDGYLFSRFNEWVKTDSRLLELFAGIGSDVPEACKCVGIKEVLAEEFYPAFTCNNVNCLNIIRDPRDVIASMSFGRGYEYTGMPRPVLFDVRNWRKSVHFAHNLRDERRFMNVSFEGLVTETERTLSAIFEWLDVEAFSTERVQEEIAQAGWLGNSSFGEREIFDSRAVGVHREVLPESVISYVEATCWPEMRELGYVPAITANERERLISKYEDPFSVDRAEFDSEYSSSDKNVEFEIDRIGLEFSEINERMFA